MWLWKTILNPEIHCKTKPQCKYRINNWSHKLWPNLWKPNIMTCTKIFSIKHYTTIQITHFIKDLLYFKKGHNVAMVAPILQNLGIMGYKNDSKIFLFLNVCLVTWEVKVSFKSFLYSTVFLFVTSVCSQVAFMLAF